MKVHPARAARWAARILLGLVLLLFVAAAGVWWWAGQEGSLEFVLRRIAKGPLQTEGVQGSVRGGWHIQRIVWERDGLVLEAEDIRLAWQPVALLNRTLQLQEVQAARARVTDRRPRSNEPMRLPDNLALPWRVNVERLQVGQFAYRGGSAIEGSNLAGGYSFDGLRHRVNLQSLQLAGGTYRGDLQLLAIAPQTIDARVSGTFLAPVPGVEDKVPLAFSLNAEGPIRGFDAKAQLRVTEAGAASARELPQATASARIEPFADMPVPRAAADVRQLDLALFWPSAPRTLLSGHVEVVPAGTATWRLQADVRNAAAGPWDAQRLPVSSAKGEGEWRNGTALVKSLTAELGGGRIAGSGAWQGEGWNFDGRVEGVDPSELHTSMAPLPLTGPVELQAKSANDVAFDVSLQAGAARVRKPVRRDAAKNGNNELLAAAGALELRDVLARGRWTGDAVAVKPLRVRTSDALLEGEGEWQLAAQSGSGRLELRAPGLQAQARGSLGETRGQGTADLSSPDVAQAQRWLARWPVVGPALKSLALRGQAQAQLAWQGGWSDPTVQARANARAVAWQPVPSRQDDPPPWSVREATLQVQGRLRDAALSLRGQAEQGQRKLELTADGRLGATLGGAATSWRGQLSTLLVQLQDPGITPGPWQVQLRRPVAWRAAGSNIELDAGEAALHAPAMRSGAPATEALLAWGPLRRQGGVLTTSGRLAGLPLAWIELVGGQQLGGSALSGDMVFDATWDAQLGATVRLNAQLARVRGDVNVLAEGGDGAAARVSAGVREARVTVASQGDQLVATLLWDSERAGRVEGQLRTRLVRTAEGAWQWPEQAPLSGRVQASLPRIGVWSLLAPPGWRLRGSLSADITVAGTRAQPELTGPIVADDLALRSVVDGIELRNGRLRAQLAGQRVVVQEFLLRGSEEGGGSGGTLVASGEGAWTRDGPVFDARAELTQLRASIRSDRQLTVSGPVSARMDRGGTTVNGELRVDRARIQIPDETPPRLGEDVIVRNANGVAETEEERKQKPQPEASQGSGTLTLAITFDLGPDFRVSGRGVDTRLVGRLEVQGASAGMPQLVGVIRTIGGTYEAYGQRMTIERGVLRFTGPVDNPALDILAVRPNMTEKVGVQVTGRAQAPHVELYSEAGLSEAEILSYIVLGRSSAGGGAETALLQRAATALLAGRRGTGKGLAGNLGLDDLTVRNDSTSGPILRVGKRFADNFYAAYERSLSGAMGTLFIFYDVSRRVTVRAEAGERTGLDLIFTFAFDGPGRPARDRARAR